jgi:diguanylate cyclase (GGDEF)-like protein
MLLELQNRILEMTARGEPLKATLDRLCLEVEKSIPGIACSVLSVDNSGLLHTLAAPSLPESYSAALDNLAIGPAVGSCGAAAFLKQPVVVIDIDNDERWRDFRNLLAPLNFAACWSTPILSEGGVVGTFAFYFREKRGPSALEQNIVEACIHLCAIAMEREERVRERQRLAFTDAMTGLPNRTRFNELFNDVTADPGSSGVLLIDIDNLKLVNDTFGHSAGDDLIKAVADRIAAAASPFPAFRLGGDEFAALVSEGEGKNLRALAGDILAELKQPAKCYGHVVIPAATIGGARVADSNDSFDLARQNADFALYHAKENLRGQYVQYSPDLRTAISDRFRAVRDVLLALADGRIEAYYQPIVRIDTAEIVGFEALCRLRSAAGKMVDAADFYEALKDAHVAVELTAKMLSIVAADMRRWLDMQLPFHHVCINLAAADFHTGRLRQQLCTIFERAGVPLEHVVLEVTEAVYLGRADHLVADEIKALRAEGFRVALDDFGTGFASLTHLLSVPVDIIKIDKSFVDRLVPGDAGLAIVEGLLGIANKLDIRVVAEGIETLDQAQQLLGLGCSLGQGYYFSRAIHREAATQLLAVSNPRVHA